MKKKIGLLICLLTASLTHAQDITVELKKDDFPGKKLKGFEYVPKGYGPINAEARDFFFDEMEIKDRIKDFDDVEKNVLFYRIKRLSTELLIKQYPQIPQEIFINAKKKLGVSI